MVKYIIILLVNVQIPNFPSRQQSKFKENPRDRCAACLALPMPGADGLGFR